MTTPRTSKQPKKAPKAPKPRKCANRPCPVKFVPCRPLQSVCSPACAVEIAIKRRQSVDQQKKKAERKEIKARKEKIKTLADWRREAQSAVNAVRRYEDEEDGLPCISCGRYHQGQYHAGHYLSRGAHPELALEPLNIFRQCAPCNTHLSGNQIKMRQGIIGRYGVERVEWLEGPHEPKKYDIAELKAIRDEYRAKLRELKKGE